MRVLVQGPLSEVKLLGKQLRGHFKAVSAVPTVSVSNANLAA